MTRAQIADPDLVAKLRAGDARAHPAVHPLQPDVPGARRPQPDRDVRRRADERARDRGPGLVRADASPAGGARGGRRPGRAGDGARGGAAGSPRPRRRARPSSSAAWPRSPARTAPLVEWLGGELAGSASPSSRRRPPWSPGAGEVVVQCSGVGAGDRCRTTIDRRCDGARRGRRPRRHVRAAGRRADRRCSTRSAARSRSRWPRSWASAAVLVTQDNIAGNELSRTGDLAPANVRLQQRGARHRAPDDRPYCPSRGGERLVRGGCCARGRGPGGGRGRGPLQRRPAGDRRGRRRRLRLPAAGHAAAWRDAASGRLRGAPHDPRGDPGGTASGDRAVAARPRGSGGGFAAGTTGAPHRPEDMP